MKCFTCVLLLFLFPSVLFAENSIFQDARSQIEHRKDIQSYQLRAYDFIRVEVFQEDDLRTEVTISSEGHCILPLIGKLKLAGLRIVEAQQLISQKYIKGEFLKNPQVNIIILDYAEKKVQVLGEVNNVGRFTIPPHKDYLTLNEALSEAGGLKQVANPRAIRVTYTDDGGNRRTRTVNFSQLIRNPNAKAIRLRAGDEVFVPESIF